MLVRERLLERLRARWFVPVTVVSAPAGYGKTTLLAQAVVANARAPAGLDGWLTCGPDAGLASWLAAELCQALGAPPCRDGEVTELVSAVVDAVWRRAPQQVALILDDVHEVSAGSEAADLLGSVIAALPANGHVVLAGRSVALPLARLEVEGRVAVVDQSDLAFTQAELAEFAAMRQVADEQVTGSDGWPALAELAASSREAMVGQYVDQEVLANWPASRRRSLARLAHLGWFDGELAHAVVGDEIDVADLVANAPLITAATGSAGRGWSVHSLWSSWLAADVTPAEVAEARERAGRVLLTRGDARAAVGLLIEAQAWDAVGDAIIEALGAVHPPVARDVLADWFARLPDHVQASPSGRLLSAVLRGYDGDEDTWCDFEACASAFRAEDDARGELASLVQLGLLAWWTEEHGRLAGVAARVFELEAAGVQAAVPLACVGRALLADIAGDSRQVLVELDRIPPGSLGETWHGIVSWIRSMAHLQLGQTEEALDLANDAWEHIGSIYPPLAGSRLQALWCLGRTGEVLEALPATYQEIERSGSRRHAALAAAQCSIAYAMTGQSERATEYLAHAGRAATVAPAAPLVDAALSVAEAVAAVIGGDEPAAAARLAALVARQPIGRGITAGFQLRHLALLYVLVPETREVWDALDLGPVWARIRRLAQAVVAVRSGRPLPVATPLDDVGLVQAHLPPPWVAELAIAAIGVGRSEGFQLLDRTWSATRTPVMRLSESDHNPAMRTAARVALARLPVPPNRCIALRLLGPIELSGDGEPVESTDWRRERVRLLLAYLALHGTASRAQVAEDLWPTLGHSAQSRNLRVTLTYLLRVLEPDRGSRDPSYFIRQHGGSLILHPGDWMTVDLWEFDDHYARATDADRNGAAPRFVLDHALRALALWPGDSSELAFEEWAVGLLEQRRLQVASLATRAAELLLARGDLDQARDLADRALSIDPWREAAHRLHVATHQAAGDHLAARRALQHYRDLLSDLNVDPDDRTLMVERLLESLSTVLPASGPLAGFP